MGFVSCCWACTQFASDSQSSPPKASSSSSSVGSSGAGSPRSPLGSSVAASSSWSLGVVPRLLRALLLFLGSCGPMSGWGSRPAMRADSLEPFLHGGTVPVPGYFPLLAGGPSPDLCHLLRGFGKSLIGPGDAPLRPRGLLSSASWAVSAGAAAIASCCWLPSSAGYGLLGDPPDGLKSGGLEMGFACANRRPSRSVSWGCWVGSVSGIAWAGG